MKQINKLIGIIGRISSGKSYLAKQIAGDHDVQIVSFGKYLFDYSKLNALPTDRNSLQNLGEEFIQRDPKDFLDKVLKHAGEIGVVIIIEGIRHKVIFDLLKSVSNHSCFIYIDENIEVRYLRYIDREKESDSKISFQDFNLVDNHSVEMGIDEIKPYCDILYNSSDSASELYESIRKKAIL